MKHRKVYHKLKTIKHTTTKKQIKHRKIYKKTHKNLLKSKIPSTIPIVSKFAITDFTNSQSSQSSQSTQLKKTSICAPFIHPTSLSKGSKLTKSNVNIIESATDESCFTIESLRKIASKWNSSNSSNPINTSTHITFDDTTSGKYLWDEINKMMSSKCKTEICWKKQDFIKDSPLARELLKNFKPMMPKKWDTNPIEWLNTIDIRDVMNQYEIKYPEFEFVGPVPMDFDTKLGFGQCVVDELCKVKLDNLIAKGDTKLGVIFNLDKHTQSGSHWVAMYCDINRGEICYWDSYGIKPENEIVVLMNRLKKQGKKLGYKLNIKINKNRHQYKNSECGVYCIYFITSLLNGKLFEEVVENIIKDDEMNEMRNEFYNKVV